MQELLQLYHTALGGAAEAEIVPLAGAGSGRRYYRITEPGGHTAVGCVGNDRAENEAFVYLSGQLAAVGVAVPQVLAVSADGMRYLLTDLGDTSLFDAVCTGRSCGIFTPDERQLLTRAVRALAHIQTAGDAAVDYARCYPASSFDRQLVEWDLNYFKYCFLKVTAVEYDEGRLQADFDGLAAELAGTGADAALGLMYRDYQSRNIMVTPDGGLAFIDFQGARRGPVEYDLASLLWQARLGLPEGLRSELTAEYVAEMQRLRPDFDAEAFRQRLPLFVLLRTLQVLGAYGLRGLAQRKSLFISSIPAAIATLRRLTDAGVTSRWPELHRVCRELASLPQWTPRQLKGGLTVTVQSFSYRRGIPDDFSGNGGGYVFDCRAIHNPGRYEQYRYLTGMDRPVAEFLEECGEAPRFLEAVKAMLGPTVERYKQRGFTDLMVSFGCTGGRHRSVYCAEQTAQWLARKYNVRVLLSHREQDVSREL